MARYFGMDRDNRWERIESAYRAIIEGKGSHSPSAIEAIETHYANNITDEFIPATIIGDYQGADKNDGLLMANFRAIGRVKYWKPC